MEPGLSSVQEVKEQRLSGRLTILSILVLWHESHSGGVRTGHSRLPGKENENSICGKTFKDASFSLADRHTASGAPAESLGSVPTLAKAVLVRGGTHSGGVAQ